MADRKWPVLASILIAIGLVHSLFRFGMGIYAGDILNLIFAGVGAVVWWNIYKFKKWALITLTVLIGLDIIFTILAILNHITPPSVGFFAIGISLLVIFYFYSNPIRAMFVQESAPEND